MVKFTARKQKEFSLESVVTQGDITPYGSASFIHYVRWYGTARDALLQWRDLGFAEKLKGHVEIETVYTNIQYKRQAMLQEEIIIKVNSANIMENKFTLLYTLIRKDDALLISLGKQDIRFKNSKTGELYPLSSKLIKNILKPLEVSEENMIYKF